MTAEQNKNPQTPQEALHQAIQDAFRLQAEWSASYQGAGQGAEQASVFLLDNDAVGTRDKMGARFQSIARNLVENERRENMLPPGSIDLICGFADSIQHLHGTSDEPGLPQIHLQRLAPSESKFPSHPSWSDSIRRYAQATEAVTIFHGNGQVTNIVLLPSKDERVVSETALGFTYNLSSEAGWDDQFVLTGSEAEKAQRRSAISEDIRQRYIVTFPKDWTPVEEEMLAQVTTAIAGLRPVEF